MAKRRGVGGAIGAGLGAGLSSLGQHLQAVAERRLENDLIMERQAALSKQNDLEASNRAKESQKAQLMQKAIEDPVFARRLQTSGLGQVLGINFPEPTSEDILAPIGAALSEAQSEEQVDTPEGVINQLRSGGGIISDTPVQGQVQVKPPQIAQLLAARNAKEEKFKQIKGAEPFTAEYMSPSGIMMRERTTVEGARGMAEPTERTNAQEAAREGAVAGAVRAAQEANTLPDTGQTGAAQSLFNAFKLLSNKINIDEGIKQLQVGAARRGKALLNQDNDAQLFLQSRQGLGVMLAVLAQGSRPTDRDAQVFADLLPSLTTPKGVAGPLLTNVESMIATNPIPISLEQILSLPPGTPIPGLTPLGRARVIQQLQSAQPNAINPDDLRLRFRQERGEGQ